MRKKRHVRQARRSSRTITATARFSLRELDALLRSLPAVDSDYGKAVRDAAKDQPSTSGDP
jgi:hypothetical protein